MGSSDFAFDEIGYWSEIKLDIVKDYASAYSGILTAQKDPGFYHVYIDGFSGPGAHISRATREFVPGSPTNALLVDPPFLEYHFVELDPGKAAALREIVSDRPEAHVYEGDCNTILLREVFPKVQYSDYRRGLCLLDPYGLHLDWEVIATAGQMKTIEVFLNFPVQDMNRNVIWRDPDRERRPADIERMNRFWGDESWRGVAYKPDKQYKLFGGVSYEKESNEAIVEGFRQRLKEMAGFKYVPQPIPMRNTRGAVVYFLFFASYNAAGGRIVGDIFKKYDFGGRGHSGFELIY
jgi:three-Cys-motif partner protein